MNRTFESSTIKNEEKRYRTMVGNNYAYSPYWVTGDEESAALGRGVVDANGNLFGVGAEPAFTSNSIGYGSDFNKISPEGKLLWQTKITPTYPTTNGGGPTGINVDSSGNIYISWGPFRQTGVSEWSACTAKLNSSGVLQWQRELQSDFSCVSAGIATSSTGNVYHTGYYWKSESPMYFRTFLVKYNTSGTLQWQVHLTPTTSDTMIPQHVKLDSSENVYIAGYVWNTSGYKNGIVVKYNSSGVLQWQKEFNSNQHNQVNDVAIDSSGNVFVGGLAENFKSAGSQYFGYVAKLDSTGALQWQRSLINTSRIQWMEVGGITVDTSGSVYATLNPHDYTVKNSWDLTYNNIVIVKYNTSGTLQWQREFNLLNSTGGDGYPFTQIYGNYSNYIYLHAQNPGAARLPNDGTLISKTLYPDGNYLLYKASFLKDAAGTAIMTNGTTTAGTASLTDYAGSASQSNDYNWYKYTPSVVGAAGTIPGAPSIGTVTVIDSTTVQVNFTPPSDNGGQPILQYDVTASPVVADIRTNPDTTTSPLTVTGTFLDNTNYTFTVAARNIHGQGSSSSASSAVTFTAYTHIASITVPSGGVNIITFTNIPQGYRSLQIRGTVRSTVNSQYCTLDLRFNHDSSTSYKGAHIESYTNSSTSGITGWTEGSYPELYLGYPPGSTIAANTFAGIIVDIDNYSDSGKFTTVKSIVTWDNSGTYSQYTDFFGGRYLKTDVVYDLQFLHYEDGKFAQYTTFSLYGIK